MDGFLSALRIVSESWPIAAMVIGLGICGIVTRTARTRERNAVAGFHKDIEIARLSNIKQIETKRNQEMG